MVARKRAEGLVCRGSNGFARFQLPAGHLVKIYADDKRVVAEMKRRGLWAQVQAQVVMGSMFALRDSRGGCVDFFMWVGSTSDGGFSWYSFPGADVNSPHVHEFVDMLLGGVFTVTPREVEIGETHGTAT
jgi:hypothetical protein